MRILAGILCGALLLTGIYFFLRKKEEASAKNLSNSSIEAISFSAKKPGIIQRRTEGLPTNVSQTAVTQPRKSKIETNSVESRVAWLQDLGTSSDQQSLQQIIAAFHDSDPQIRKAAVEAAMQFGSRDAIPDLQKMAAHTEDAREKVQILDAIDFLNLPSLTEIKRSRRAQ